eukprot:1129542-Prymnesium_polylepis.1
MCRRHQARRAVRRSLAPPGRGQCVRRRVLRSPAPPPQSAPPPSLAVPHHKRRSQRAAARARWWLPWVREAPRGMMTCRRETLCILRWPSNRRADPPAPTE